MDKSFYDRQLLLKEVGFDGQKKLEKASVLVVGAGGLGCPLVQYLTLLGVGQIGVVDGDVVSYSNLHRQFLFHNKDVGFKKVNVLKNRMKESNNSVGITIFPMYIDVSNVKEIIDQYDLVVDCTDNYETRFLLNDACYLYGKPLVYGAVFRFQGQISVFNYKSGVTYRCLQSSFPQENSIIDCNSDGVVGLVPGIVAMYQGIEVMKICLKREDVLDGEILLLDLLASKHYKMKIQKSNFDYASILVGNKLYTENYRFECHLSQDEITIDEIQLIQEEFILIDVREWGEEPEFEGENIVRCPISFVEQEVDFLKNDLKYIVLCQSGKRSVQWVKKNKKEGVWMKSLKGGIQKEENKLWIKLFTYEELF